MYPNIILGTVQFGLEYGINNVSGIPDEEAIHEILKHSYDIGIRSIDTAEIYGKAVECIGTFHRKTGLHFDIHSKFIGTRPEIVEAELQNNLEKMDVPQLATFSYHTFKKYEANLDLHRGLEKMKAKKLIRSVGLSVYTNEEFQTAINDDVIDLIQVPFNLLDNYAQRGYYLELARSRKKTIQARSVFLQGLFFKDLNTLPERLIPLRPYLAQLHTIAEDYGLSMESLCLRYVNAQPLIDEIVIGIDNKMQLIRNAKSLGGELPAGVREKIDSINVKEDLLYPYKWL